MTLIQYNWCPYEKGKFEHRERHTHGEDHRQEHGEKAVTREPRREPGTDSRCTALEGASSAHT